MRGVQKSYRHASGEISVLRGVDAEIAPGSTVAVLGPSGSGKSTLLSLMAGLDKPTSGVVAIAGEDIGAMDEEALTGFRASRLGIVFQQFHLMSHLSALENVALPLYIAGDGKARPRAVEALRQVGLEKRLSHFPHELSGGECQRVAIARALVAAPPLLLADEPSGNLDARTGDQVMRLLFDLVRERGTTLVLVTHNEELAKWCDSRLTLSDGKLLHA
jgi:putative ABC transport system ATP-binding protein